MSKIIEVFEKICKENESEIAFYYKENKIIKSKTFKEVYDEVILIANDLKNKGVNKGDRIFTFATSNYKLCLYIMATFKIGASIMYIDLFSKQESINKIFDKYKPQYILISNKTRYIKPFISKINIIKKVINVDKKVNEPTNNTWETIEENTYALLTTTTGQTGNAKIYIRTHKDLYNQLDVIMNNIDKVNCNTILTTSYIYTFANLLLGKTTIIPNLNLKKSSKKINKKMLLFNKIPIDTFITSPDFLLKVDNNFSNLKTIYFGGAIINYNEANKIYCKFKNCKINYIYGSTECNIISINSLNNYINSLKQHHINNLGKPINEVNVRINNEQDIIVSGKNLLTKNIDGDNNLNEINTNDDGYILKDEIIYLGRKKSKFRINEKLIYYNEIEQEIILEFPKIEKCAFINNSNMYYLFIKKVKIKKDYIREFIKKKYDIKINIIELKEIPCDIKHHTKIDYEKLKRMI